MNPQTNQMQLHKQELTAGTTEEAQLRRIVLCLGVPYDMLEIALKMGRQVLLNLLSSSIMFLHHPYFSWQGYFQYQEDKSTTGLFCEFFCK